MSRGRQPRDRIIAAGRHADKGYNHALLVLGLIDPSPELAVLPFCIVALRRPRVSSSGQYRWKHNLSLREYPFGSILGCGAVAPARVAPAHPHLQPRMALRERCPNRRCWTTAIRGRSSPANTFTPRQD